jgi:hypothetical protein
MTAAEFQERVESVIGMLERMHDRQYPLRNIPMDLVAEAVAAEARQAGLNSWTVISTRQIEGVEDLVDLTPYQIASVLNTILARNAYLPGSALHFATSPDQFDRSSPWEASSYLPHDGVERLRDGG